MTPKNDNHAFLDHYIDAAREVDDAALSAAVTNFRASLPEARPARRGIPAWLRLGGAVALLVLAVSIVPTFLPKQSGGQAFALVQAWFEDYQTMQVDITMMMGDARISEVRVWSRANGATRVEVQPVVHIIDPESKVMHTILNGNQVMTRELGIAAGTLPGDGHLEWLQELREFQGVATVLEQPLQVDGIDAMGWQLNLEGQSYTLWVDPADNRPLLMEAELPGGMFMIVVFSFNEVFSAELFQPPAAD